MSENLIYPRIPALTGAQKLALAQEILAFVEEKCPASQYQGQAEAMLYAMQARTFPGYVRELVCGMR
jgi:hypothetical protein